MAKQEPPKDFLDWLGLTEAPRWGAARPLGALFSVVLILLFFAALLAAFAELGRAILRPESGGGIGAGALIVALLGAPFLIWNTVIKHRALGFQKEGLMTDRIAKMVEQLGAEKTVKKEGKGGATIEWSEPNIEVRVGALFALERIAQDSVAYDKGRDHIRLMEILCAYVRHNAPVGDLVEKPAVVTKTPRMDIQVAIDVLKRRSPAQRQLEAEARYRTNLSHADLDGVDFSNGDLTATLFQGSSLARSNFAFTNLTATNFTKTLLDDAFFGEALMRGTDLRYATGDGSIWAFVRTKFSGTFIEGANLPCLYVDAENAEYILGSADTKLSDANAEHQPEGLKIAKARFYANSATKRGLPASAVPEPTPEQSFFVHWNPYKESDLMAGEFRQSFKEKHGLIGWPFDNTPPVTKDF